QPPIAGVAIALPSPERPRRGLGTHPGRRGAMKGHFTNEIAEGMIVRSADGEKLGKVVLCEARTFQVEKGFFFPREFTVKYEEITEMRAGVIILARGRWALLSGKVAEETREGREAAAPEKD